MIINVMGQKNCHKEYYKKIIKKTKETDCCSLSLFIRFIYSPNGKSNVPPLLLELSSEEVSGIFSVV